MSPDSSTALRLAALYGATFLGLGVQLPFLPVWLAERGFDASEIGLLLAIPMLARLLVSPWIAGLADGRAGAVRVLVVAALATLAAFAAMPFSHGLAAMGVLVALASVAQSPMMPLCDVLTIGAVKRHPRLHYGRIRLWGSIAYLVANLAAGVLIGALGPPVIVPAIAAAAALLGLAASRAPTERPPPAATAERLERRRIPAVLKAAIAAAALVQASHAMIYAFGSLSFEAAGYSPASWGVLWGTGVVAEILLFGAFGGAVGTGFPAFLFLALGAAGATVRWAIMALGPPGWCLPLLMAGHGLSFGATHLGTIGAFALYAPEGARARSQGIFTSANALAMGLATLACGPLYRAFGQAGFAGMVPMTLAGLALVLVAMRLAAQPQSAREGGRTTLPS